MFTYTIWSTVSGFHCSIYAYQWSPICVQITYSNFWDELANSHYEKIKVQKKFKLLKQDLWESSNDNALYQPENYYKHKMKVPLGET